MVTMCFPAIIRRVNKGRHTAGLRGNHVCLTSQSEEGTHRNGDSDADRWQ